MNQDLHAYMWATIAAGVASSPLRHRTPQQVAEETDKILLEYEGRRDKLFPPPPATNEGRF